jgi:CubicO group peptidase (beta-lactamase class C family)
MTASFTTQLLATKNNSEKSMRKLIVLLGLLFVVGSAPVALSEVSDDPNATGFIANRLNRIDDAINAEIAAGKIPGAVALVLRNGNVAYFKSFGFADVDSKVPMQNDSIFRIASMSKAITSVAAMTLYEQGHFQLNDPVAKYIPEFAEMAVVSAVDDDGNVLSTVAATTPIKIIDLLTHTSGISYPFISSRVQKSYVDAGVIDGITVKDTTLASQMALLAKQPLLFEPGSEFAYGLNTDLLGYLIEVISGQSLAEFFATEIFAPLDMHDSFFYLPKDKADRLATLYADVGDGGLVVSQGDESTIFLDDPRYPVSGARSYFSGGAGLSSTAHDYGRFLQMLLNDGELDGARILSRKSVELIRVARVDWDDDQVPDFALGFQVVSDLGKNDELGSVGSYSWGGAFYTSFWVDPREDLVGVFMSQARPVSSDISDKFSTLVYQALE